jgi:steroid delta-isomerase-like uncharacterized protein
MAFPATMTEEASMATPEEHKALHRRVTEELWNKGNVDAVDEHLHPQARGRHHGEGMGPEDLKAVVRELREAFPDLRVTIDHQVAEGDELVSFATISGTHRGTLRGVAATGNPVSMKGVCHTRFQNGKVVEETVLYDHLGALQQLGISPDAIDLTPHVAGR